MKRILNRVSRSYLWLVPLTVLFALTTCCLFSAPASAGSLEPSGSPSDSSTRMYSTQQIYDLANAGKEPVLATSFSNPGSGPGSTMRTLSDICNLIKAKFSECNVGADDVLAGKYFFATELTSGGTGPWGKTAGTIPNRGNGGTITPGTSDQTIAYGYWKTNNTVLGDAFLAAANIASGVSIFSVPGSAALASGDAAVTEVLDGKFFSITGSAGLEGTMPHNVGDTSASSSSVSGTTLKFLAPQGYYDGVADNVVKEDSSFIAGNIKDTVTIFGVLGTYTGGGGGAYGLPKTSQQPDHPSGWTPVTGDDAYYADPTASDIGYPQGLPSWTAYNDPGGRFTDNADGTIIDNATGLEWIKDPIADPGEVFASQMAWADAIANCEALVYPAGGHEDWRLPNRFELESILDLGRLPAFNPTFFPNTQEATYWSSTTTAGNTTQAHLVYFGNGNVWDSGKADARYVRPVRGGVIL